MDTRAAKIEGVAWLHQFRYGFEKQLYADGRWLDQQMAGRGLLRAVGFQPKASQPQPDVENKVAGVKYLLNSLLVGKAVEAVVLESGQRFSGKLKTYDLHEGSITLVTSSNAEPVVTVCEPQIDTDAENRTLKIVSLIELFTETACRSLS